MSIKIIDKYFLCILMQKSKQNAATSIQQNSNKIIQHNQIRYIPGIQVCFNTGKTITLIHNINRKWRKLYGHFNL